MGDGCDQGRIQGGFVGRGPAGSLKGAKKRRKRKGKEEREKRGKERREQEREKIGKSI